MSDERPRPWDDLRRAISLHQCRIGVVGQGYVGLTLSSAAASEGFSVVGVDIDEARASELSAGRLVVPGVDSQLFLSAVASGNLSFASHADALKDTDVLVICVPTPLRDNSPDLSFVETATQSVGEHMSPGSLVILESTTYPGTTDNLVRGILESNGWILDRDFLLAYSPERIDPGNSLYSMRDTPRVVGGASAESLDTAHTFYGQLVDQVVPVASTRAAETAKLLENTFRHVNIALVNELAMICHEMDIDVWEVIDAADSKPFGFMKFSPGPGVGGHCIPLDPTYLSWQVRRESGRRFALLEQAQDINERMPNYIVSRIAELLNEGGKALRGSTVCVLGIAYKPDIADIRESPALQILSALEKRGAVISFHDPYVSEIDVSGRTLPGVTLHDAIRSADCVVLHTPHAAYDLIEIASRSRLIFDTRHAIATSASHVVAL